MPIDPSMIQPNAPQAPAAPDVEPQDPQAQEPQAPQGSIPPQVLKLPFMNGLLAGAPVAVSDRIKDFTTKPAAKLLYENKDALQAAGLGFYKSLSGEIGVIFNALHIHPEDILAADKAGKLTTIAPDLDKVDHAISKSGKDNPVLHTRGVPGGMAMSQSAQIPPQAGAQAAQPGPQSPGGPSMAPQMSGGAPAGIQRKLMQARLMSQQPGAPTSGPTPGSGRLLNSILKPVV